MDNWIQFVAIAGNWCSVQGASVPHHPQATKHSPTAYNKLRSLVENTKSHKLLCAIKSRRVWKQRLWPATLERPGISLNKNSQMTQASNLIIGVSSKTEYVMLFVYLNNQRTGDKLVPTNARVESLRRVHRDPACAVWTRWCLQWPHFHAVHKRRCFPASIPPLLLFPFFPSLF